MNSTRASPLQVLLQIRIQISVILCYLSNFINLFQPKIPTFLCTWHRMLGYFMTLPFPLPDPLSWCLAFPSGLLDTFVTSLMRCRLWQNIADLSPRQSLPKKMHPRRPQPFFHIHCSICVHVCGCSSSWCWQFLVHLKWGQHESQRTFSFYCYLGIYDV